MSDTLYESYVPTTDNIAYASAGAHRKQSFRPSTSHNITSFKGELSRSVNAGNFVVDVYEAEETEWPPTITGALIATGSIAVSGISTSPTVYEITMDSPGALTAGTRYLVDMYCTSTGEVGIGCLVAGAYAGGMFSNYEWDMLFYEYGTPAGTAYTLDCTTGEFVLTPKETIFTKALNLITSTTAYVLTGIDVALNRGINLITATTAYILTGIGVDFNKKGWTNQTKHDASATNLTKHDASATNASKNDSSVTNISKS